MNKKENLTSQDVLDICSEYMNNEHLNLINKAYLFAKRVHKNQLRQSGEPYIIHPIQVAGILAKLHMDPYTVVAGYLHDVVEDTNVTLEDINVNFGKEISIVVDGVTKISKIRYKSHQEQLAENYRKLLLAMSKDLRVIIVKLADRLHNMRTLNYLRDDKQIRIANETLEIYSPLANRLGINAIKWELEDLSLRYLKPKKYYQIVHLMNSKREERIYYINEIIKDISDAINGINIDYKVYGRPKHIYSIYRKMRDQNKQFNQIYDLLAIRVIVNSIRDCYAVLGAVHTRWKPMPGRFKDYIAMPKANMYQSIHTTVIGSKGRLFEVQIRTKNMHKVAEYGIAAHWAYKEGKTMPIRETVTGNKLNIFKEIIELHDEISNAKDFMESVKGDLFSDRVYAFTPKGDTIELPKGAGPLDMAYCIHTEIGNHTIGAKVNGRIVPLNYEIKNGDIVDILTSPNSFGPSKDWVKFVHTNRARNKIRKFFKNNNRLKNLDKGKQIIDQELINQGYNPSNVLNHKNIQRVLIKKQLSSIEDLYVNLGFGDLQPAGIINLLTRDIRNRKSASISKQFEKKVLRTSKLDNKSNTFDQKININKFLIDGIDNMLVHISKCCDPIPGDNIIGYITNGRGISVHRIECHNIKNIKSNENNDKKLIHVKWNGIHNNQEFYNSKLRIQGYNRNNLLSDVLKIVNSNTKNVRSINGNLVHGQSIVIIIEITIQNKIHLERLISSINQISGITSIERIIN